MDKIFPKGSEWRRWDLHVHSPESTLANQFTNWEEYLTAIENAGDSVAVIGVTDYASIAGYKILRNSKDNDDRISEILELFPNIEFRVTPETQDNKGINIHIVVNPKDPDHISLIEQALGRLTFEFDDNEYSCNEVGLTALGKAYLGDDSSAEKCFKEGVNQFKPPFDLLKNWYLKEGWLRENSLIGVANGSSDGASGIQQDNGLKATREKIYKFSDFIFSANPKDCAYFVGEGVDDAEKVTERYGSLKPCLHGSDAHSNDQIFNPDKSRNCWIKADPTFNGLKQVCFEPKDRVRIQEANPLHDFKKPYFSKLECEGYIFGSGVPEFTKTVVPLNPGLVTLIGGRGTGKSLLLDSVHHLFHQNESKIELESFEVEFTKTDLSQTVYIDGDDADLDYLHVKQGDIKRVAEKPEELSSALKQLLSISTDDEKPDYDYEMETIIERIEKSLAWFDITDSEGKKVNDLERNKRAIQSNKNLIATITTEENKENIASYQTNSKSINDRKSFLSKLAELKTKLTSVKVDINRDIEDINQSTFTDKNLTSLDFGIQLEQIEAIITEVGNYISELEGSNSEIEKTFKSQGIDQDVEGLLEKLGQYQKEIDRAEEKITEHASRSKSIGDDIVQRTNLVDLIDQDLQSKLQNIRDSFKLVREGKASWNEEQKALVSKLLEPINIDGEISFRLDKFYDGLVPLLNGKKFRSSETETQLQKIEAKLNVRNYKDYLALLRNEKVIDDGDGGLISLNDFANQKEYFLKNNFNIYEYLYLYAYRKRYLNVVPVIEYLGKSPDKLSVGQRGTFYVCMKLATDPFGSPFIFDQPEDDLDNKFIMGELVPLFREIKKYRQVIIATHNANLVVNADAEQILVASNEDEILSYISGSLENSSEQPPLGIRENVCDILEGGKTAFESRERKYGFTNK